MQFHLSNLLSKKQEMNTEIYLKNKKNVKREYGRNRHNMKKKNKD